MMQEFFPGPGLITNTESCWCATSGIVYWDGSTQQMKVIDEFCGNKNNIHPSRVSLNLDPNMEVLVAWANKKMADEMELDALCEKYPGLKESREIFQVMERMCKK